MWLNRDDLVELDLKLTSDIPMEWFSLRVSDTLMYVRISYITIQIGYDRNSPVYQKINMNTQICKKTGHDALSFCIPRKKEEKENASFY